MDCTRCQYLESELGRLAGTHAEKAGIRKESWHNVRPSEHSRLRGLESDALLALEIARAALNQHKRNDHITG
jgi:hypothetical protein